MQIQKHVLLALVATAALAIPAVAAGPQLNVPDGQYHKALPRLINIYYTAVVNAAGKLVRNRNATGSKHLSTGEYEVDFISDVSGCTYVATVGEPGSLGEEPPAYIQVAPRSGNVNGVWLEINAVGGAVTNLPFHIDVAC